MWELIRANKRSSIVLMVLMAFVLLILGYVIGYVVTSSPAGGFIGISDKGLALDPETGKPIPVRGKVDRTHTAIFTGRTAKEIGMKITEETKPCPLSRLDHALYLGREFVRAEIALINGTEYVQD